MGVFSQIFIYSLYNDTERTCSYFKLYFQDFTILSQLPPTPTTAINNPQSLFLITTTKRLASFNLARFLNWGKMNSKLTYKLAQAYSILQTKTGNEVLQTFSKGVLAWICKGLCYLFFYLESRKARPRLFRHEISQSSG